jgi:uncharacterized protein (TIGR02118 family)
MRASPTTNDRQDHETQRYDRRAMMLAAGQIAAAGIAATAAVGAPGRAEAQGKPGQECMTIVYANGDGVHFDFDYYEKTHMPRIMSLYGRSISRFELRRGQPGADGAKPPYVATITIWIADPAAFDAANTEHQPALRADVSKFTNATLIAQRDKIVATAG